MKAIISRLESRLTVAKPISLLSSRWLDNSFITGHPIAGRCSRIQRPRQVVLHLRSIGLPQRVQLSDWVYIRPVNPQIDDRPDHVAYHLERRRVHGSRFTTGRDRGAHRREQAVGKRAGRLLERLNHCFYHLRASQHVAGGHALLTRHGVVNAQRFLTSEKRRMALTIDHRDLSILAPPVGVERPVQGRSRRKLPGFEEVEDLRPEGRQRDILCRHRPYTRAQPWASSTHRDTG